MKWWSNIKRFFTSDLAKQAELETATSNLMEACNILRRLDEQVCQIERRLDSLSARQEERENEAVSILQANKKAHEDSIIYLREFQNNLQVAVRSAETTLMRRYIEHRSELVKDIETQHSKMSGRLDRFAERIHKIESNDSRKLSKDARETLRMYMDADDKLREIKDKLAACGRLVRIMIEAANSFAASNESRAALEDSAAHIEKLNDSLQVREAEKDAGI